MAISAFDDKTKEPRTAELNKILGRSAAHWGNLVSHIEAAFPPLDKTWRFGGAKWGWSLRLKQKKRTVLNMTPCNKHFSVGFMLGEKAVKAAHAVPLPDSILDVIDDAPKYAEGRGVLIEVRNKKQQEAVKALAAVKMAN